MVWAMINKHHHGFSIKSAPFPVLHTGRVKHEKMLDLNKVQDEIMGSALYAGLQEFLLTKEQHDFLFTPAEITKVWQATNTALNIRIARLKHSFYRINGLAKVLFNYPELTELCEYLTSSFNPTSISKLETQVKKMNEHHIREFLNQIVPYSTCFAKAHQKIVEIIE